MLLSAVTRGRDDLDTVTHGRCGNVGARPQNEVGVHSIRGGTIIGEHSVIFAGADEVIELKHTALSRTIFARGALTVARKLTALPPALYTMKDVL